MSGKPNFKVARNLELADTFVEAVGPIGFDGNIFRIDLLAIRLEPKSENEVEKIGWPVSRIVVSVATANELVRAIASALSEAEKMSKDSESYN